MADALTIDEAKELEILKMRSTLGKVARPVNPTERRPGDDEALQRMIAKGLIVHLDRCYLPHLTGALAKMLFDVYQTTPAGEAWAVTHGAPRRIE